LDGGKREVKPRKRGQKRKQHLATEPVTTSKRKNKLRLAPNKNGWVEHGQPSQAALESRILPEIKIEDQKKRSVQKGLCQRNASLGGREGKKWSKEQCSSRGSTAAAVQEEKVRTWKDAQGWRTLTKLGTPSEWSFVRKKKDTGNSRD